VKGGAELLELSLHVLDLLENATRAGATEVHVTLREDPGLDQLEIAVEDNGPGLPTAPENVLDPFYTTKQGKRTGLGLSLFRAAAEQAGGTFCLGSSETLGGTAARATFRLGHVDRAPLGDLADTLTSIILTHPEVNVCCTIRTARGETAAASVDIARELGAPRPNSFAVASEFGQRIRAALTESRA
jgi:hypothetical protein